MNARKLFALKPGGKVRLHKFDPADTNGFKDERAAKALVEKNVARMFELQNVLYAEGKRSVLVVLQGMDASGKDGTVRHVMTGLNPMGVQVTAFKRPSEEELAHDYLWRVHNACPPRGVIGVFNRSHYEDVLVVRVNNLVPKHVWKQRYDQINDFERTLAENGTTIIKCFLHISKDEQAERLNERIHDPDKNWKFQAGDLDVRKQWDDYQEAYEAALERCSTDWAPWHIVPADCKWFRNVVVSELIVEHMEAMDLKLPKAQADWSRVTIK